MNAADFRWVPNSHPTGTEVWDEDGHWITCTPAKSALRNHGPVQLREHTYFVMGDNREASEDSRGFGPVPEDALLGRLVAIFPTGPRAGRVRFDPSEQWKTIANDKSRMGQEIGTKPGVVPPERPGDRLRWYLTGHRASLLPTSPFCGSYRDKMLDRNRFPWLKSTPPVCPLSRVLTCLQFLKGSPESLAVRLLNPILSDLVGR